MCFVVFALYRYAWPEYSKDIQVCIEEGSYNYNGFYLHTKMNRSEARLGLNPPTYEGALDSSPGGYMLPRYIADTSYYVVSRKLPDGSWLNAYFFDGSDTVYAISHVRFGPFTTID